MTTEKIMELLRTRADELKQQCEAKMNSIGMISEAAETEEQRKTRNSAQSDFDTSAELYRLIAQIEGS